MDNRDQYIFNRMAEERSRAISGYEAIIAREDSSTEAREAQLRGFKTGLLYFDRMHKAREEAVAEYDEKKLSAVYRLLKDSPYFVEILQRLHKLPEDVQDRAISHCLTLLDTIAEATE